METELFSAFQVDEDPTGTFRRTIVQRKIRDLPAGDVLVRVHYSSLNYKDALSATGNRGVTRTYPHTPGIDAAGLVVESSSTNFQPGDEVLAGAGELGVSTPGGFGQYIRIPADWLLHRPPGLSLRETMIYGSAGFTAALMVDRLETAGIWPGQGEILVTGASGGVGSVAVGILALEGFDIVAVTGKAHQAAFLNALGAGEVILRSDFDDASNRPLLKARWAGVIDTVGGRYLSTAIRSTRPDGVVTACGNAASPELSLTVFPFILRGISLLGIDATRAIHADRERLWGKLGREWKLPGLEQLAREVSLNQLEVEIERILRGGQTGRVVVRLD